jgi:hypothetical protein
MAGQPAGQGLQQPPYGVKAVNVRPHKDCDEQGSNSSSSSTDPSPKSRAGDAQVFVQDGTSSIYNLYSPRRRNTILLAAAFASILVPFCDTIYLPALAVSTNRGGRGRWCLLWPAQLCHCALVC